MLKIRRHFIVNLILLKV